MSIFTPQVSTPILIEGSEKIILHFTTLSVKIHFKIILELFLYKKGKKIVRARSALACVAGGIVRVRGKILTAESEYGRRSREENGKEPL